MAEFEIPDYTITKRKIDENTPYLQLPDVCPVSGDWLDLTDKVNDITWDIMQLITDDYAAYDMKFIRSDRPVCREDFDEVRMKRLRDLYVTLIGGMNSELTGDFVRPRHVMAELATGYGMNNVDVQIYSSLRQKLQEKELPLQPKDKEAQEKMFFIHSMSRFSMFKHGELLTQKIAGTVMKASHDLTKNASQLYPGENPADRTPVNIFEDLVELATVPFSGGELPVLRRIAYFDQVFIPNLKGMHNPNPLLNRPMKEYIDAARNLSEDKLPQSYHPGMLFQKRR